MVCGVASARASYAPIFACGQPCAMHTVHRPAYTAHTDENDFIANQHLRAIISVCRSFENEIKYTKRASPRMCAISMAELKQYSIPIECAESTRIIYIILCQSNSNLYKCSSRRVSNFYIFCRQPWKQRSAYVSFVLIHLKNYFYHIYWRRTWNVRVICRRSFAQT